MEVAAIEDERRLRPRPQGESDALPKHLDSVAIADVARCDPDGQRQEQYNVVRHVQLVTQSCLPEVARIAPRSLLVRLLVAAESTRRALPMLAEAASQALPGERDPWIRALLVRAVTGDNPGASDKEGAIESVEFRLTQRSGPQRSEVVSGPPFRFDFALAGGGTREAIVRRAPLVSVPLVGDVAVRPLETSTR